MAKCKKRPDHETFHWVNLNPKGNAAGDCVVRAICAFLHWDWEKTYKELAEHGLKTGYIINDDENYQTFLSAKGFEKKKMPKRGDGSKYTATEFCKEIAQPGHEYVLRLANHLTFVGPDCRIWDCWDCGYKSVGNYWESENIGY